MSQTNDLRNAFNLGCPACGQARELLIMISTLARLTPDGSEPEGDHEWDEGSYCRCPECGHDGDVADFDQSVFDAEKASTTKLSGGAE